MAITQTTRQHLDATNKDEPGMGGREGLRFVEQMGFVARTIPNNSWTNEGIGTVILIRNGRRCDI